MKRLRLAVVTALVVVVTALVGAGSAAFAAPPGPGDVQCVPGKNGPPHPGFKPPPSCPGPHH